MENIALVIIGLAIIYQSYVLIRNQRKLKSDMKKMKDDYNIPTESKVMRIIIDYLQENNDVHDTVFKQTRCLRCE